MPRTKQRDRGSRDWYQLQRWRNRAKHQLRIEPLCAFCKAQGCNEPACIADHIEPHDGSPNKFWLGKLQSLCKRCHDSTKQKIEIDAARRPRFGLDGLPMYGDHPIYGTQQFKATGVAPPPTASVLRERERFDHWFERELDDD